MPGQWLDEGRQFHGQLAGAPLPKFPDPEPSGKTLHPELTKRELQAFDMFVAVPDVALAGFIVWDVFRDADETMADIGMATFGCAVANSTELIVASVIRGDWGEEVDQRDIYVDSFKQWLDSDDITPEERERIIKGYF